MAVFQKAKTIALEYAYRDLEAIAAKVTANKEAFARRVEEIRVDQTLSLFGKRESIKQEYQAFSTRHKQYREEYTNKVQEKYSDLRDLAIGVKAGKDGEADRAALARVMAIKDRQQLVELVSVARATNDSVLKKALAAGGFIREDWNLYRDMANDLASGNDPNAAALLEFEEGFGRLASLDRKMQMNIFVSLPSEPIIQE